MISGTVEIIIIKKKHCGKIQETTWLVYLTLNENLNLLKEEFCVTSIWINFYISCKCSCITGFMLPELVFKIKTNYWTLLMCQRVTVPWKQVLDICMWLKWVESNSVGNQWSKQNCVRPISLITSNCIITDPTGLHKVLLPINHNYNRKMWFWDSIWFCV